MIFLNPAVLFGLLASSIPVLIHLFNLRKLKKIEFSTLTFLKELQKNKIRKVKLKQWILLALRMLIIIFLVTAFSRPTIKGVALGGTTSSAKTTAVFVIDNTFSMSVVANKGSYFNQAKQAVYDLLSHLQEGDEAAIILISDQSGEEIKATNNLVDLKKQIDNLQLSYSSGSFNNALIKAANIVGASKNFNKEIYILSDFRKNHLGRNDQITDLGHLLDDKVKLYAVNYTGKDIVNLGIDKLEVNTQIFEKNKPVSFNATITNYSKEPVANAVAALFVNGQRAAQKSISLAEGETKSVPFETAVKNSGNNDVYVELEDDDIMQDNIRYANIYVPDKVQIGVFTDEESDASFVETALTLSDGESAMNITQKNLSQLNSVDLSKFAGVIVIGSENISNQERLTSYVNNGGGVMLFPGSRSSLGRLQGLCRAFGIPGPQRFAGKANQAQNAASFGNVEFDSPLFQNLFESKDKKKIESPDIYQYAVINPAGKGKNIISMIDNSAFLSEYKYGRGKVLLFAAAPVLGWSNFPLKAIFVPLVNKGVSYLSSKEKDNTEYFAGSPIDLNLYKYPIPHIRVVKGHGNDDNINIDSKNGSKIYTYTNTNTVGNYKFYSGDNLADNIAVNANPDESRPEVLSKGDFEDYLKKVNFKGRFINISNDDNIINAVLQARYGSELWKYFLFIALLLALTEMAVARNAKRELASV